MYLLILLAVSLAASAVGWKYFIYFFSLGYGFAVAALALALLIIFAGAVTPASALLLAVMFIFGCRLSGYLFYRERKAAEYRKILFDPAVKKKKPLGAVLAVWFSCAMLYVGQVSPVAFRLANVSGGVHASETWAWIGAVMMILGVGLESAADLQKNAAKKVNPKRFVDTGLYRIVRCPNYLGELVIWTGAFVSAIGAGLVWWQWLIAALGWLGIVYVMFSGARRLELRQREVYGSDPAFREYSLRTPILLPFVPVYSLARFEWLKA
mgnify:CR=1 FL=1